LRAWRTRGRRVEDHPLAAQTPVLAGGWDAQRARRSTAFTRWDGNTGPLPEGMLIDLASRAHSPTSLQRWAECPHRYLFGSLLRIAEREEPEPQLRITPLDRGSLVHEVLDRFIRERPPSAPDTPWSDADRARLLEILDEVCEQAEATGSTGAAVLWRLDRAALEREMMLFLETDAAFRRTHGVVPIASELAFGDHGDIAIELRDGRAVRLRGRIDRVDRSPDGRRTVVLDYKSGSTWGYTKLGDDAVNAGTRLQLPVYAAGVDEAGRDTEIEAYYWFTRPDIEDSQRLIGYPVGEAVSERFREVTGQILAGIGSGIFVSVSGSWNDRDAVHNNCRFCAFDDICPRDREREFTRKAQTSEVQRFQALAVPGSSAFEDGAS
jgi:hypothetical protein